MPTGVSETKLQFMTIVIAGMKQFPVENSAKIYLLKSAQLLQNNAFRSLSSYLTGQTLNIICEWLLLRLFSIKQNCFSTIIGHLFDVI